VQNRGRVVVVSSESYKIQAMFQPYMISKAALESYCRVAWQELTLKGVSLTVIRPGAIDTPLLSWQHSDPQFKDSIFAKEFKASFAESKKLVGNVTSAAKVAEVILKSATARKPKRFYRVNNNPLVTLISFLPSWWLDELIVWRIREKSRNHMTSD
jgi:NAD(P)-dependent dehydrogenase (short-subunit alcohol dehydrogenase family)